MPGRHAVSDLKGASRLCPAMAERVVGGKDRRAQFTTLVCVCYGALCLQVFGAACKLETRLEGSRMRAVGLQPLLLDASASSSITAAEGPAAWSDHRACACASS